MHTSQQPAAKTYATSQDELSGSERQVNGGVFAAHQIIRSGSNRLLTTDELATELGISAQSIRKRYSQTGTYFGLRPAKLPNRRLLWPTDAVDLLLNSGGEK
ncbi:helix-turn-helix transcriptional regulator [Burkholderia cepacia]|uniref:helix-turn-helix transcriptional regulator n=1 Tax=Burkholderia cepacia TaxID=292 RepID=UPI0012AA84A3|nr:helix-turn-helix domain-containing protein [Burkholderia cepacia]QFS37639.1 putative DNA-binding transcriptional regulator YafY, contains an HTH and WYL domai [Burkholderia cepacia]